MAVELILMKLKSLSRKSGYHECRKGSRVLVKDFKQELLYFSCIHCHILIYLLTR